MFREDGSSRGFGFVAFDDPEEAEKAVTELHGKESPEGKVSGYLIYVPRDKMSIQVLLNISDILCGPCSKES